MLNGKELAFVVGQAGPLVDDEHRRALACDGVVVHVEAFEGDAVVLVKTPGIQSLPFHRAESRWV
jgi:hypothetical protein